MGTITALILIAVSSQRVVADFDGDKRTETVTITSTAVEQGHPTGGGVLVQRSGKTVWRQGGLNPWKICAPDVNGDGRREIAVGVWKKSPKDPVMAKRVFVYSFNGQRLMPEWLGSRLSRRFEDFTFADGNHDKWDELYALEVSPGKWPRVSVYRWASFGFECLGSTRETQGMNSLRLVGGQVMVEVQGKQSRVDIGDGKVRLTGGGSDR